MRIEFGPDADVVRALSAAIQRRRVQVTDPRGTVTGVVYRVGAAPPVVVVVPDDGGPEATFNIAEIESVVIL